MYPSPFNAPLSSSGDGTRDGCRPIRCSDEPCFSGVACRDGPRGFRCGACPQGYVGDGTKEGCRHVTRDCSTRPCFQDVACKDTEHGFECGACPAGYMGDGITCVDINEVGRSSCSLAQPTVGWLRNYAEKTVWLLTRLLFVYPRDLYNATNSQTLP